MRAKKRLKKKVNKHSEVIIGCCCCFFLELELWKLDFGWPKGCPWPINELEAFLGGEKLPISPRLEILVKIFRN